MSAILNRIIELERERAHLNTEYTTVDDSLERQTIARRLVTIRGELEPLWVQRRIELAGQSTAPGAILPDPWSKRRD